MAIGFVAGRKQDLLGIRTFAWCFAWTYPPVAIKHKYISSKNENSAIFSHLSDVCAWSDLRTRTDTSLETSTNLQYPVQSISENDLKTGGLGCSRTLEVKNSWSRRPNRCLWVMRVFHVSCHHLHGLHWPKLQPRSDFQPFQPNHILMCHQSAPSSWRPARSKSEKCFMFFFSKNQKATSLSKRSRTPQALAGRRPTCETAARFGKAESGRFRGAHDVLPLLPPPKWGGKGLGTGQKCTFAAAAASPRPVPAPVPVPPRKLGAADLGRSVEDWEPRFPKTSLHALCGLRLSLTSLGSLGSDWIFTKSSRASRWRCNRENFEALVCWASTIASWFSWLLLMLTWNFMIMSLSVW